MKAATAAGLLFALPLIGCSTGMQPPVAPAPLTVSTATISPSLPTTPAVSSGPVLAASAPLSLTIPAIDLRTDLLHLGLREDGSLEVPEDKGHGTPASWYHGSPTPGERGPSVILGHVNALGGNKGVFADLHELRPGDEISLTRLDGSTVVFVVDRGALYSKNSFPTFEVYGNTPGAELRLITCNGYDSATGLFNDNYVIYAKLKA